MKIMYNQYHFSGKEWILYGAEGIGICVFINYLFYQTLIAYIFMFPIPLCWMAWQRKRKIIERKKRLHMDFKEALSAMRISLQAGHSVERAIGDTCTELRRMYGKEEEIVKEFTYMVRQLELRIPAEQLMLDLGNRSQIEDIMNFASVFAIAKRTGGNVIQIIGNTAEKLSDKIQVEKEIQAAVASKKFEQTIMSSMPFLIILYMHICSPELLSVLYGNVLGAVVMTACLVIYGISFWWGRKIVDIEV